MSSDPYCPEIHNASDSEDSDYEVQSLPSSDDVDNKPMDCGQCWDCEKNKDCPAKLDEKKIQEKADEVQKMIKEEVRKQVKPEKNYKDSKEYKEMTEAFPNMTDEEKIHAFAIFLNRNGGIDVNNIIEFKKLVILIGATAQMEGFEEFPREACYKLLEMMTYHTNKHLEILDV